jgi:hypothetical protein
MDRTVFRFTLHNLIVKRAIHRPVSKMKRKRSRV